MHESTLILRRTVPRYLCIRNIPSKTWIEKNTTYVIPLTNVYMHMLTNICPPPLIVFQLPGRVVVACSLPAEEFPRFSHVDNI
jgi:hypothetical protein